MTPPVKAPRCRICGNRLRQVANLWVHHRIPEGLLHKPEIETAR